jgi:hypothetical protein
MSSAAHLVTLEEDRRGGRRQVVLRRYVRPEVNAEYPDQAEREGRTLRFVELLDVATPQLLAVDPTGNNVGVPGLSMTRVSGRVDRIVHRRRTMDSLSLQRRLARSDARRAVGLTRRDPGRRGQVSGSCATRRPARGRRYYNRGEGNTHGHHNGKYAGPGHYPQSRSVCATAFCRGRRSSGWSARVT